MQNSNWVLAAHECPGFEKFSPGPHLEKNGYAHHTEYLSIKVEKRYGFLNITNLANEVVKRSKIIDGFCFVSTMHITAGIFVNDAESGLLEDIGKWIEKLAPFQPQYLHHLTGEDNADAHLKSYLTNHFIQVPISNSKLDLGQWQQIFYAEFDGLRSKKVVIKSTGMTTQ